MTQFTRLDRTVTIEHPIKTRDSFGSVITNYEPLTTVWASKRETKGKERFVNDANRTVATRAATWRVNFDPSITELWRVVDSDRRVWNIIGIAVVGFKKFHDLICQSDGEILSPPESDSEAKGGEDGGARVPLPKPTR